MRCAMPTRPFPPPLSHCPLTWSGRARWMDPWTLPRAGSCGCGAQSRHTASAARRTPNPRYGPVAGERVSVGGQLNESGLVEDSRRVCRNLVARQAGQRIDTLLQGKQAKGQTPGCKDQDSPRWRGQGPRDQTTWPSMDSHP